MCKNSTIFVNNRIKEMILKHAAPPSVGDRSVHPRFPTFQPFLLASLRTLEATPSECRCSTLYFRCTNIPISFILPGLPLRHPCRRRPVARPSRSCLNPMRIPHRYTAFHLSTTHPHLLLHVRAVLDVLAEMAYVAADFFVGFYGEGDYGHEAECKPLPSLQYSSRDVAAVLALDREVFRAGERGLERVRSAGEEEEHVAGILRAVLFALR